MKIRTLKPEEVPNLCDHYEFVLVYEVSQMHFGKTGELKKNLRWQEVIEARFFGQDGEIHLYDDGDGPKAYEIIDDDRSDDAIVIEDVEYALADKFSKTGKTVKVRQYLDFDEDGQAVVCCKRLAGVR